MKKRIVSMLTGIASIVLITGCTTHSAQPGVQKAVVWTSGQIAAANSVEGQLRSNGKKWIETTGEIRTGSYVQDLLEGRLNQPEGRGAIGKVISVRNADNGQPVALVDFGRGYQVPIQESELSLVKVE